MLLKQKNPHGGDIYDKKIKLDFSSNLNPAGMPEAVKAAIIEAAEDCSAYPDPYCRRLREKLSAAEGVPSDAILCGNGAAELIYAYAYALPKDRPALIVSPTFCEYETALQAAELAVRHYLLREENGFRLTDDILQIDFSGYSALFLCTPNNPTGITVEPALLEALCKTGTRVFADMCFLDLSDEPGKYDIPALVRRYPNLTVLRAFTKNYAMAGVRLGYALCTDEGFLTRMSGKTQCWNVSSLAQKAGEAALGCADWLRQSASRIKIERERVANALRQLGVRVFDGKADYLLLYSGGTDLYARLLEKGILTRDCSNYTGLCKGYIRIAIRSQTDNDRLLAAIREVLS